VKEGNGFLLSFNDITFALVLMRANMTNLQAVNRVTHADIGFIGSDTQVINI
jgi:hypothetical protein